jgi:hypothetical protein
MFAEPDPDLVGDGPYRLLRALFFSALAVFTALLFSLAFYEYPTGWPLVRTLGLFGGLVALSAFPPASRRGGNGDLSCGAAPQ